MYYNTVMRDFKIVLFLGFVVLTCCNACFSAQIVYPKTSSVTINSPTTFFIGNESPKNELTINGEKVKLHSSGGFYHVVNLTEGNNTFTIDNKVSPPVIYTITRPKVSDKTEDIKYKEYELPAVYLTKSNNVPLRNAPDDRGESRLQNIQVNTPFNVIGEYGNFYKVKLAQDDYAWIGKNNLVKQPSEFDNSPAKILSFTFEEDAAKKTYTIKLDKKVPFILSEKRSFELIDNKYQPYANGLDLTIFNLKNFPDNKYELGINTKFKLFGYKAGYNNGNELIIEIKKVPDISTKKSLKGLRITLDPGHGGSEYGAIGCLGDKEKDINLAIALKTKEVLEKAGANVYITRTSDIDLGLYERVLFSQANNTDIFISIHGNALPDSQAATYRSGTGVYYFYPQSNHLARIMQETLVKELGTKDDKVRQESFAVIRNTESIAILLEVGYMISPDDNAKLVTPEFQQKTANSILHALERYANEIKQE